MIGRTSRISSAGIAQLVEHNLAKVGVAGSSPVSRSPRQRGLESSVVVQFGSGLRGFRAVSSVG